MPELPEVETIARDLREKLVGRSIEDVVVAWEGCVDRPSPDAFCEQIVGRRIEAVHRRGKFLVFGLSGGGALLAHLRMTGSFLIKEPMDPWETHARLAFALDNGKELRFADVRKFGRLYLVESPEEVVGDLGPEPLDEDFDLQAFGRLFEKRRGMIKPLLLNQRFLAGLGNIYVDEALFRARLHPRRAVDSITRKELGRLYDAIRGVLQAAITNQGTSRSDYVRPDGTQGRHQDELLVSGKAGEPCPNCRTEIERIVVGGRGTFLCPRCQVRPADSSGQLS